VVLESEDYKRDNLLMKEEMATETWPDVRSISVKFGGSILFGFNFEL